MINDNTEDNNEQDDIYNDDVTSIINNIKWTPEHENILVEWADQAMCYKWMHAQARIQYNRINTWFTIPVIPVTFSPMVMFM